MPVAPPPATDDDETPLAATERLAALRNDLRLRLLREALNRASRPGQQEILFEVKMQAGQGDPSPAATVARSKGVKPDSVRQTCKRLVDRVNDLAATVSYFAPLADLHLLRKAS